MPTDRAWSVEQHVRADADSIFVPAEHLDGAESGDLVDVVSPDDASSRRGRVDERIVDAERGDAFIVRLDPPDPSMT